MIFFEFFYTFFLIGLFTFGGGYAMIPLIQNMVISKGWINEDTLTNFIAISESTPGPFAINISTFIGSTVGGPFGAICATIGVILPSLIIIIIIAMIINKFLKNKYVKGGLNGIIPVAISLILSTTIILFIKLMFFGGNSFTSEFAFDRKAFALFLILGSGMFIYKKVNKKAVNPILLIVVAAIFGIIIYL